MRLPAILLLCVVGCQRADVDTLTKIAGTLGDRAENLAAKAPRMPNPLERKLNRADRVSFRLENDKALAGVGIVVTETERGVKLSGKLKDDAVKARALDLARETVDSGEVEDDLMVANVEKID